MKSVIRGYAKARLCRRTPKAPVTIEWPVGVQQAAMATLTRDELMRLGLYEALHNFVGIVNVEIVIKSSGAVETAEFLNEPAEPEVEPVEADSEAE